MELPCHNYRIYECLNGVCNVCVPLVQSEQVEEEETEAVREPIEITVEVTAQKQGIKARTQ